MIKLAMLLACYVPDHTESAMKAQIRDYLGTATTFFSTFQSCQTNLPMICGHVRTRIGTQRWFGFEDMVILEQEFPDQFDDMWRAACLEPTGQV